MTPKEKLAKVRELLSDPSHWTKEVFARNEAGQVTAVQDPKATCFCLMGAIQKITNRDHDSADAIAALIYKEQLRQGFQETGIATFNDNTFTTHKNVLNLLDAAIANAS